VRACRRPRLFDTLVRATAVIALLAWSAAPLLAQAAKPVPAQTTKPQVAAQAQAQAEDEGFSFESNNLLGDLQSGVANAAVRLPIAALLGTALALRPRRASSPPRSSAVIETQIVLAVVGALIMLVIGASLARAFGIAGAANLIRYRANIEDPKDAVVMLCTLSIGLASGVGLFGIAAFGTVFIGLTLWIIEGFETHVRTFLLTIKLGEKTSSRRAGVERILKKAKTAFELRTTSDEELSYLVSAGASLKTEQLAGDFAALAPNEKTQIEWREEKKARPIADKDKDEE
jgi:hypothetical protein